MSSYYYKYKKTILLVQTYCIIVIGVMETLHYYYKSKKSILLR